MKTNAMSRGNRRCHPRREKYETRRCCYYDGRQNVIDLPRHSEVVVVVINWGYFETLDRGFSAPAKNDGKPPRPAAHLNTSNPHA